MKKILFYLPRVISWLFTVALLVVFSGSMIIDCSASNIKWLLIPIASGLVSYFSLKRPLVGGIAFSFLGLIFTLYLLFGTEGKIQLTQLFIVALPILIAGILFIVEVIQNKYKKKS